MATRPPQSKLFGYLPAVHATLIDRLHPQLRNDVETHKGRNVTIEWLGLSKLIPAGSSAAKSVYDRVVGRSPRLDFYADGGGIGLHVFNTRAETVIIERIDAYPPLLGFSEGEEIIDMVRAVVAQRGHGVERPIAILSPDEKAAIKVITFDPFETSHQATMIKVRVYWRTAKRQMFSRSSVTSKITVGDIMDLKSAVERKQPRMFVV